jgi:hypothetical protein
MADPPAHPDADDGAGTPVDRGTPTGTPRWVKVFGAIVLLVVVLFIVVVLIRGGEHGPGRHGGSNVDTPQGHAGPPVGVTHDQP